MVGRLADAVVLSEDERRFLEGQVRRHKAPRSLSDRCRMIRDRSVKEPWRTAGRPGYAADAA